MSVVADFEVNGKFRRTTGEIILREGAGLKTEIHEIIHSYSNIKTERSQVEGLGNRIKFKSAEEACVDLLSEEICKSNGVGFSRTKKYARKTDELRAIADALNISYIDFGVKLVETEASTTYTYIKRLAKRAGVKLSW